MQGIIETYLYMKLFSDLPPIETVDRHMACCKAQQMFYYILHKKMKGDLLKALSTYKTLLVVIYKQKVKNMVWAFTVIT